MMMAQLDSLEYAVVLEGGPMGPMVRQAAVSPASPA